ncbi:MAG: MFS transporter [Streptosporangiaceae bacterium]
MARYRRVLAVPGMAPLLGISLLARVAVTAVVMALTMYVVLGLDMSYAAAGGVAAALTAGIALGSPLLGRMIDRWGLRAVLLTTVVSQIVFWLSVPVLPYWILLGAAFTTGLLMVPAQSVTRQAIAAMTTVGQLRAAAFALESVQGELSYMVGPPVVVLCAAKASPDVMAWSVGAAIVAGGAGIALLNPPLRAGDEAAAAAAGQPRRRQWLGAPMIAALTMASGTTMLLSGVDLAIIATLREAGQVSWAAVVIAAQATAHLAAARPARAGDDSRRTGPRLALAVRGRHRSRHPHRAGSFNSGRRGEPAGARQRARRSNGSAILGDERGRRARIPDRRGRDRPVRAGRRLRGGGPGGPGRRLDRLPACPQGTRRHAAAA